ncbi:MAG: tRNA uridine-5-carboxymethylaminomethyl(34) synthesis GTPase MnmE [Solobacterium sp.]|nr:tRNA uridine-5-carboxymethylaminomethyl(34) synthesis GTPase MnmE [Solobacterium sp.]
MNETIAAIATAQGGALSVIRVSGEDAITIVNRIFSRDLSDAKGYTLHYGEIRDGDEVIDEVLVSVFRAPRSYTGENMVEISGHGGVYVSRNVLSLVLGAGARMARRGEFTERAFLNGKMDLAQAESVNDLVTAKDSVNARSAVHGLKGSVKRLLEPLIDSLSEIVALIEVNIDYPEYDDVKQLSEEELLPKTIAWIDEIDTLIRKAQAAVTIRTGLDTVILGRPNVGKSSLLNALLEEDKAIVTDIAGTTRDLVEGTVRIDDLTLNLIDTAGIHETGDTIEQIGIEKSRKALEQADLAIVVIDGTAGLTEEDRELLTLTEGMQRVVVYNKNDQAEVEGELSISALNRDIEPLLKRIKEMYADGLLAAKEETLNNERQIGLAMQAKASMEAVKASLEAGDEIDLVTVDLQNAWYALKEITGETGREDLLDEIFSRFCLGK